MVEKRTGPGSRALQSQRRPVSWAPVTDGDSSWAEQLGPIHRMGMQFQDQPDAASAMSAASALRLTVSTDRQPGGSQVLMSESARGGRALTAVLKEQDLNPGDWPRCPKSPSFEAGERMWSSTTGLTR